MKDVCTVHGTIGVHLEVIVVAIEIDPMSHESGPTELSIPSDTKTSFPRSNP